MIKDEHISVVFQGPVQHGGQVSKSTAEAIAELRNGWPHCEIILSTWNGQNVSGIIVDKILFNSDPGAISFNDDDFRDRFNNLNRQIVSTCAGLRHANRKYSIKIRTDCSLHPSKFDAFLENIPDRSCMSFFRQKILIPSVYTADSLNVNALYHPSDIFQFGLTDDLRRLWSVDLAKEPEHTRYFQHHKPPILRLSGMYYFLRCASEQYVWTTFLARNGVKVNLRYTSDYGVVKALQSSTLILRNFISADASLFGLVLPNHLAIYEKDPRNKLLNFNRWKKLVSDMENHPLGYWCSGFCQVIATLRRFRATQLFMLASNAHRKSPVPIPQRVKKFISAGIRKLGIFE